MCTGSVATGVQSRWVYGLTVEDYVLFMRGLRAFTIAMLVATLSVSLLASSAIGDTFRSDPDDTSTSFDIHTIRTQKHAPRQALLFSIITYDVLQWTPRTAVWIYLDSRAGPSYDFLLTTTVHNDRAHCDLYSRDSLVGPVGVHVGPKRVICRVKRSLLAIRPTHIVRFYVRAISWSGGHQVNDRAPGRIGTWYPHV